VSEIARGFDIPIMLALALQLGVAPRRSVENEPDIAMIGAFRRTSGHAIDAIELSEQHGRLIVWIGETVIGPRQLPHARQVPQVPILEW
jgi:hypothetical protein